MIPQCYEAEEPDHCQLRVTASSSAHPTAVCAASPVSSNNTEFQTQPGDGKAPVYFIEEKDIRKICFHELFVENSCSQKREKCTFSHDIPPELRKCDMLINKVKNIQAAAKRRKRSNGNGVVNRF